MSKRFELINFLNAHDDFRDNKNNKKLDSFDVVKLLNHYDELQTLIFEKDQRIAELEEQLKNAIVPKFKTYDTVYAINRARADGVESGKITEICFDGYKVIYQFTIHQTNYSHTYNYREEKDVFATKEEAQAKLEELRGE